LKHLNTIACLALAIALGLPTQGNSLESEPSTDRFTNADLMEQPAHIRRAWLSGLIVGAAHGLGLKDSEAGECVARWYFEDADQSYANIIENLERYPDHEPAVVVLALARRECPTV
jgi:hypothetical protein